MFGVHSGHQETPGAPEGQPEAHRECNPGRIRIMLPAKLNGTEPPVRNATERPGSKQANPVRKQETRTGPRTKRTRNRRYGTQLQPANPKRNGTGRPGTEPADPGTQPKVRNGTGRPEPKQADPVRKQETRTGTRTKRTRDCRYGTQLEPANQERNRQTRYGAGAKHD